MEYVNLAKLERARVSAGEEATEEVIREHYLALGGLLRDVDSPKEVEVVEEAPKAKKKK